MFRPHSDGKLKLIPLNPDALSHEPVLIKCQHNCKLDNYRAEFSDQLIIISFLNFTALDIAAQLATNHQFLDTPEVIFVDNSQLAEKFWNLFCEFMREGHRVFKADLKKFLTNNANLICPEQLTPAQKDFYLNDSCEYICSLFEKYDAKYFCNLISNAKYIRQTWSSIKTFADLRDYFMKNQYYFTFVFNGTDLIPSGAHPSFNLAPVSVMKRQRLTSVEENKHETEKKDSRHISFSP